MSTPKGYWIARVDVHDPDTYAEYSRRAYEAITAHGGRFLVRGGTFTAVEGDARGRNVVVEFESYDRALACWNSPEYQAAREVRRPVSDGDFVVVSGPE